MPPGGAAGTLAGMKSKSRVTAASTFLVGTVLAAALLATGCGGGSSNGTAGGSSNTPTAARYTSCMRSHGIPEYPEPDSNGQLPKITPSNVQQYGVSTAKLNAAQTACGKYWPFQPPTAAQAR